VNDLHEGGAVMWIGGAAIMFAVIMMTFFQWTRETRPSAGMGWLETVRRASMADRMAETEPAQTATVPPSARAAGGPGRTVDVDEDEDQLAAYNAYLARINRGQTTGSAAE
jgi:putative copper resistance protein D